MNSSRWNEIKALLGAVLDRPLAEQRQFLAAYPAEPDLKAEVTRILDGESERGKFLEPPSKSTVEAPLRMISLAFAGCSIGDYELLEDLGRGASGTVYRAKQVSLGRPAAVKILAHHLCASEQARERFRREAEAASKLRHEAIVSIFSFGEQSGAFYIAMELVTGENLRDLIAARGSQPHDLILHRTQSRCDLSDPLVVAALVEKLARGLHHCHEHCVIHRDVKPENIVIDAKSLPRLIDFGLAKDSALEGMTDTGMLAGTPHYMSPEQVTGPSTAVDHRTDIYSLGVVLYELLALRRPFENIKPADLLSAIGHQDPLHVARARAGIPPGLAAICMKAVAKRPSDRYQTAEAMGEDLLLFISGRRTLAPTYSIIRRARDLAVHRPRETIVGTLILSVGLAWGLPHGLSLQGVPSDSSGQLEPSVQEMRKAFENSVKGLPEHERLKQRASFNAYLKQRIRDNER